jgi:hypothetical protein
MADPDPTTALRDLLHDSFGRIRELVEGLTDGLSRDVAGYRPDPEANTIGWLIWHLTRVQDGHLADLDGAEQIWTANGWYERFALPFAKSATGYGQSASDVGKVVVEPDLLDGYQADVDARTQKFIDTLDAAAMSRVVDTRWDPPVTLSVRLVSVIGDCLQHLGQAAYLRGLASRAGV